ncbi:hypothetical protein EGW08_021007 [Elysia chlorotica]|uniref:Coiled-coil domain-containing protein 186 n=1 Tax=Elysia chlorotica TaxID=188477 RepID=A0A3S1AXY9_ELYCH|nr:hypothetical protein EGW08_021007 [Elysia chlorotica]
MSWVEPESGGADGVVENPDPEEDSDLPARGLHGQVDGEGARIEQDRPEDDLAIAAIDPAGDQASGACEERVGDVPLEGAAGCGSAENHGDSAREVVVGHEAVAHGAVEQSDNPAVAVNGGNVEREGLVNDGQQRLESVADRSLPEANGGNVQVLGEQERRPENGGNADADVEEEDSFEQDEETAAPECESGVRLDSTSESDRQPVNFQTEAEGNPMGETANRGTSSANVEASSMPNGASANPVDHSIDSGNSEQPPSISHDGGVASDATGSSVSNIGHFSGNVEVSASAEDAPEAEMDNLQQSSSQRRESALQDTSGRAVDPVSPPVLQAANPERHIHAPNGSNSNHSIPGQSPRTSADHDMQAPECDRETAPQPQVQMENLNTREAAQLPSISNEHPSANNPVASCSQQEAIAALPANVCQQPNTSDSSSTVTLPEQDRPRPDREPNTIQETPEERPQAVAQSCIVEAKHVSSESESLSSQASGSQPNSEEPSILQSTNNLNESSIPRQSQCSVDSSSDQSSVNRASLTSQELGNQSPTSPPSNSATSKPCSQNDSVQNEEPSPKVSGSSTLTMTNDALSSVAAHRKEDNTRSLKGASISSSSSSSNTSQRTSPAKAVAAALFHVMGMDSKFTGKDLALALQSDDEDDLMSELNAELLSGSSSSSSKPKPSQNQEQTDHTRRQHKTKVKQKPQTQASEVTNGLPPPGDGLRLQEHNRQLLEQLRIRDEEIARLSRGQRPETQTTVENLLSSHSADDLYLPQIKELEKTIAQQGAEIKTLTEKLYTHDTAAKRTVLSLQNEMKARVDQATKMYEECRKEKDMMVVKFAESEAKTMEARKVTEKSEAKVRDALRDRDNMASALKAAKTDRQKAIANHDAKCTEVSNLHKELEKMKEAVNSGEYRIKWFQNKLKDELDAHKDTKGNLEKTNLRLKEAREETELIRKECQAIVKRYQESEEIKSNSLEKDLKLKESELQTHLQERNDTEELHQMLQQELESLKAQHKDTLEEAKTLRDKVKCLEDERQQNHNMIENFQEIMQKQKSDNTDLTSKLNGLATLEDDYNRAQNMIQSLDKDISDLKVTNRDLQKDMDACRERESKMLTLQSELSRANAMLRSENTNLTNKASSLDSEVELLKLQVQQLDQQVRDLTGNLENQNEKHKENTDHLVKSLAQKTKESNEFKQKWEDEMDSSKTLKRRHANNIKDLTRQLQQARRKLMVHEGKGDSGSMGSRTNSSGSLNSADNGQHQHHGDHHNAQPAPIAPPQEFPVITEQVEVDKNVLIERIVRLQKSHARKNEKLEFLGEHIQQLLEEIKKKTKIIQSYALREEAGTLSSDDMDAHKTLLAKKGGIMASVYSVHQQDGTMTLDLSLQINKKLQAVLEDTLLKNITLKENLDTLGEEIARLSQENRRLQLHLQDLEKRPR